MNKTFTENRGIFTNPVVEKYLAYEPAMQVDQLAGDIYTVSDGKYRTVFVDAGDSVAAFDTFGTPGRARAYRAAMERQLPGKTVGTLIYTHDHLDHAGFAADLAPDAAIIAHTQADEVIRLRKADGQLPATETISAAEHELKLGNTECVLLHPGPVHGTGHLSAYFPAEKILFSSDTVLPNARYGLMPDIHLANFVKFMRGFLGMDWDVFVPGRYEVTNKARFAEGCDYIDGLQIATQQAFVEMVPIWVHDVMAEYCSQALGERFGHLDGFEEHIGQTAIRIVHHYLMGGWGLEDTPKPSVMLSSCDARP